MYCLCLLVRLAGMSGYWMGTVWSVIPILVQSDSKKEDLVSLVSKYRYHGFYKYHKCATALLDAGHEAGCVVCYNTWVERSECIGARSTTLPKKYNFLSFVPEVSI